jgi:hypothetical protein
MVFEIVGEIEAVEVIASGHQVRDRRRLRARYGGRRWQKLKGVATVRLSDGRLLRAEVHWHEAHGVGPVLTKIKRFVD